MQKIILLEDGIKDYIRHCARERKLSENTLKSYRIVLNKFRRFVWKNMQIDQIQEVTKEVIRVYLEHLNESWKSSTARHHINVVQGFFHIWKKMRSSKIPLFARCIYESGNRSGCRKH